MSTYGHATFLLSVHTYVWVSGSIEYKQWLLRCVYTALNETLYLLKKTPHQKVSAVLFLNALVEI